MTTIEDLLDALSERIRESLPKHKVIVFSPPTLSSSLWERFAEEQGEGHRVITVTSPK